MVMLCCFGSSTPSSGRSTATGTAHIEKGVSSSDVAQSSNQAQVAHAPSQASGNGVANPNAKSSERRSPAASEVQVASSLPSGSMRSVDAAVAPVAPASPAPAVVAQEKGSPAAADAADQNGVAVHVLDNGEGTDVSLRPWEANGPLVQQLPPDTTPAAALLALAAAPAKRPLPRPSTLPITLQTPELNIPSFTISKPLTAACLNKTAVAAAAAGVTVRARPRSTIELRGKHGPANEGAMLAMKTTSFTVGKHAALQSVGVLQNTTIIDMVVKSQPIHHTSSPRLKALTADKIDISSNASSNNSNSTPGA